jgi:cobalt-precorrin-6B (C15)-methyltransferase
MKLDKVLGDVFHCLSYSSKLLDDGLKLKILFLGHFEILIDPRNVLIITDSIWGNLALMLRSSLKSTIAQPFRSPREFIKIILIRASWIGLTFYSRPAILTGMKLPGTATQEENIYIAMGKLNIEPGHVFLDIGCGSGAVSLAASRFTDRIYGLDARAEAVKATRSNVPIGRFFLGKAEELLADLPSVDRCFIGGTRGVDEFFPRLLEKAAPGCIIVADLARIGIAARMAEMMKEAGIFQELIQIHISRGYDLAGDMALKPVNPIFMVIGKC